MNPQQPNYAPNTVNQTVDFGGYRWKGNPGSGWSLDGKTGDSGNSGASAGGILDQAKQILNFQIEANKPIANALTAQKATVSDRYRELVNSIKQQQNVSEQSATLNTNNELARRGISGGGLYDKELTNAVVPIQAAYSGQIANANASEISDLNDLALKIAQAQAGDPNAALGYSTNIAQQQQQASQFQQQLAQQLLLGTYQSPYQTAQANYYNALAGAGNSLNKKALTDIFG